MSIKEQILSLFENQKGVYFSGEEIANQLSVSRTAVWKAVKSLKQEGYRIDAVANKGYCLSTESDILSAQGIGKYLDGDCGCIQLDVMTSVTSTNTLAREKAQAGAAEGYTIVASEQTQGRGRKGRSFFSPADTGIYMSLVLRPERCTGEKASRMTSMAAVAVSEAIEAVSGVEAGIKWVNDIFVGGKKVCGILTEAAIGLEEGYVEYAILGIGVNVLPPKNDFPQELEPIAGTVFHEAESDCKNRLAAEILNRFMKYYSGSRNYVEAYKQRSIALGREVQVITPNGQRKAKALDLDEECRLLVQYEDGTTEYLFSGEISIKLSE